MLNCCRKSGEQFVFEYDEMDLKSDVVYKLMFKMILEYFDSMEYEEVD